MLSGVLVMQVRCIYSTLYSKKCSEMSKAFCKTPICLLRLSAHILRLCMSSDNKLLDLLLLNVCPLLGQSSTLQNNVVGSASSNTGMGGGLYMADKCSGSSCTHVTSTLTDVNFTSNYAHMVSCNFGEGHQYSFTKAKAILFLLFLSGGASQLEIRYGLTKHEDDACVLIAGWRRCVV